MFIDIIIGLALAYGFYLGYNRGIIKALFALASLLLAIMAAMKLSPLMIGFLEKIVSWDPRLIVIAGFVLTFIIVVIGVRFLGKFIEGLFKSLQINFVNKMAGGVLMSFIMISVFSTIIWFMDEVRLLNQNTKSSSITYEYVEPIPEGLADLGRLIKPFFANFWNKTADAMDQIREKSEERKRLEKEE